MKVKTTFKNQVWTIAVQGVTFRVNAQNGTNLTQLNKIQKLARKLAK